MKRVLAGISAVTLLAFGLVGCGQVATKLSFKDTVTSIASVDDGSGSLTISLNSTDENTQDIQMNTSFLFDGLNVSIKTLGASSGDENYTLDDSIKFVDGNLYLNLSNIVADVIQGKDELSIPNETVTFLQNYVSNIGWFEIPLDYYTDDYYDKYKAIAEEISSAVGDAIESSDVKIKTLKTNSFEISAEDTETINEIINPIYTTLAENKETYLNEYVELYNELDFNKLFNDYEDIACDIIDGLCTEFDVEFDDESRDYIRDRLDDAVAQINLEEIKSNLTSSVTNTYDSILSILKSTESIGYTPINLDYKVSLTGNLSNQELTVTYVNSNGDEYTLDVVYELSAGLDTTVAKPSSKSIVDLVPTVANIIRDKVEDYQSYSIDDEDEDEDTEDILTKYKGYTLYEILNDYGVISNGEDEIIPYCETLEN